MHPAQRRFVWINVLGGTAGLATHPTTRGGMWGGAPDGLRPLYTVSMLLAAAGYFPLAGFLISGVAPATARVLAAILVGSALWMPLTFAMLEAPSAPLWWAIRAVLTVVGAASLGVLGALLDAIVWPAFFPVP